MGRKWTAKWAAKEPDGQRGRKGSVRAAEVANPQLWAMAAAQGGPGGVGTAMKGFTTAIRPST